jgi:lipopolysaccharide transport system ATP-binding protein
MSDTVIRVENLSKKYIIRHQQAQRYTALRDVIADGVKSIGRRLSGAKQDPSMGSTQEEFWALKDVSFEVKQGDRVGIIGRNGAGKSTLLKILSRITQPTTGEITLNGRVASLLEVGTGFHPELTGRENIYLNGAILGMGKSEIKKNFDEIVDFAEVEKFLDTPVKHYSSGMYVRLAFAVAAHLEPEILIVDEVLAVGDSSFQKKCLGKMEDVAEKEGRTVLFVSHNMAAISNLCSKGIWLNKGEIVSLGKANDVMSEYVLHGTQSQGEVLWSDIETAPGNENVRLQSIKIICNGVPTSEVLIDQEIAITMRYYNYHKNAILLSNIHLKDKNESFVFASANFACCNLLTDEWHAQKRPLGLYETTCIIPANFLNDQYYSVDVGIINDVQEWQVWEKSIISFRVNDTGVMKEEYMGDWVGVVRPKLAWRTIRLGEQNVT